MRTRNRGLVARTRGVVIAALSTGLFGCPNQELAPLQPCTVSGVSLEVPQSGVDKVDIMFVIDDSGSMAEEQRKLAAVLGDMVAILTTGFKDGKVQPGVKPDFPPVQSMHIGVVSQDMGVEGAPPLNSCGTKSFLPDDPDPNTSGKRISKPLGDDGVLQTSVAVAVAGIFSSTQNGGMSTEIVAPDPTCGGVTFPVGQRFITFTAGTTDPNDTAERFTCIAKLGHNGCGLEQHLEAMLKALTPPDSKIKFTQASLNGQGTAIDAKNVSGPNAGFLREDAILAVVIVGDEDDSSLPDSSAVAMFDPNSTSLPGGVNVRSGLPENAKYLYDVNSRYVEGLKALKPAAYQDRIIVAGIVGMPSFPNAGPLVHTGADIDAILARPDMQPKVVAGVQGPTSDSLAPACTSAMGDGTAVPGIRQLQLVKAFGDNGVATSICEDEYGSALKVIIDKIAAQLTGACLPRKLNPDANGKVACDVVEIKAQGSTEACDPAKGRIAQLPPRIVDGTSRTVCQMQQVPGGQGGEGWYYDDSSMEVQQQCQKNPQRIAFTANANPSPGSQAKFECFQPVVAGVTVDDKGRDAVDLDCKQDPLAPTAPYGDDKCSARENGAPLICVSDSCQLGCERDSQCPDGWLCIPVPGGGKQTSGYCVNPTCPPPSQ